MRFIKLTFLSVLFLSSLGLAKEPLLTKDTDVLHVYVEEVQGPNQSRFGVSKQSIHRIHIKKRSKESLLLSSFAITDVQNVLESTQGEHVKRVIDIERLEDKTFVTEVWAKESDQPFSWKMALRYKTAKDEKEMAFTVKSSDLPDNMKKTDAKEVAYKASISQPLTSTAGTSLDKKLSNVDYLLAERLENERQQRCQNSIRWFARKLQDATKHMQRTNNNLSEEMDEQIELTKKYQDGDRRSIDISDYHFQSEVFAEEAREILEEYKAKEWVYASDRSSLNKAYSRIEEDQCVQENELSDFSRAMRELDDYKDEAISHYKKVVAQMDENVYQLKKAQRRVKRQKEKASEFNVMKFAAFTAGAYIGGMGSLDSATQARILNSAAMDSFGESKGMSNTYATVQSINQEFAQKREFNRQLNANIAAQNAQNKKQYELQAREYESQASSDIQKRFQKTSVVKKRPAQRDNVYKQNCIKNGGEWLDATNNCKHVHHVQWNGPNYITKDGQVRSENDRRNVSTLNATEQRENSQYSQNGYVSSTATSKGTSFNKTSSKESYDYTPPKNIEGEYPFAPHRLDQAIDLAIGTTRQAASEECGYSPKKTRIQWGNLICKKSNNGKEAYCKQRAVVTCNNKCTEEYCGTKRPVNRNVTVWE